MRQRPVGRGALAEPPRDPSGTLFRPSEETQVVGRTHATGGKQDGKDGEHEM